MSALTDDQVKGVIKHIELSWPGPEMKGVAPDMWARDLVPLECFECAIAAVDTLRRSQAYPASPAIFLQTYMAVHKNNPEHQAKQLTEAKLQDSAYMLAAKRLIFGPGNDLLTTPIADLDVEGAGLKAKILDTGERHRVWLLERQPTTDMVVELTNLGDALEMWYEPRKADLERAKVARQRRLEAKSQQQHAHASGVDKPRRRSSQR